jgi:hypothetical protein
VRVKRGFATSLLLSLGLTIVPVSAFSAQKITPGTACKVAKQKATYLNKTYTCTRVGKKLVWSQGVVVTKQTPAPKPQFIAPTLPRTFQELDSNLSGIIYGSWVKASEQIKSGTSSLGDVKIFNGPNATPGNIDPLIPINLTAKLFSKFEQPKVVYAIIISYGDAQWAQGIFNQYQDLTYGNIRTAVGEICPVRECGQSIAFHNSKWEGILLLQNGVRGINPESDIRINSGMEYSHEYFHTVQQYTGRDRYYEAPSWFLEGSANWTGNVVAFNNDYNAYVSWRSKDLREQYTNSTVFTSAWVQEFLNSYSTKKPAGKYAIFDYYNGPYPRYYQYAIGAMVTEILVSLKGPDSILAIYKALGNGKTFEQAFEGEFGVEWNTALPSISKAISAQLNQQVKS